MVRFDVSPRHVQTQEMLIRMFVGADAAAVGGVGKDLSKRLEVKTGQVDFKIRCPSQGASTNRGRASSLHYLSFPTTNWPAEILGDRIPVPMYPAEEQKAPDVFPEKRKRRVQRGLGKKYVEIGEASILCTVSTSVLLFLPWSPE